jgi:hypothetical protein
MEITFEVLNIKIFPLLVSILTLIGLINAMVSTVHVLKYANDLVNYIRSESSYTSANTTNSAENDDSSK